MLYIFAETSSYEFEEICANLKEKCCMLQAVEKTIDSPENCVNDSEVSVKLETTQADLIINYLNQMGIDMVFGVPGGAIEPFMNALARSERQGGPRLVVARHECGAAFMADGYYRETGKMGVVCSTTGPGATNLLTGVGSAKAEEIPMLVITAQTPLPKFGKCALQESSCTAIDTVGIFQHVTQFSTLVSHHEQLESKLVSAIMAAHRRPFGPAHLSIPSDILRTPATIKPHIHADLLLHDFALCDETAILRLCEKLARVDNIVMYIGSGAGKNMKQVMDFVALTGAAFVTGPMDKGWVNEKHPQYRGVYGFAGHQTAHELLASDDVDLILAVGTSLSELSTRGWQDDLLNTKLIHIDNSLEHFTRSPMANLHVCGNIGSIFTRLVGELRRNNCWNKQWLTLPNAANQAPPETPVKDNYLRETAACVSNRLPIKPQRLMHSLNKKLPENTRIFIDAGNAWAWATHYLNRSNDQGLYRIAMGFGSMAWSVGAAIGSSAANPIAPTMCIVGDGSYLMSAQEITVAAQHNLPVVFLVLNDSAMGMVMHGQQLGGQESIGWQLNDIDYAMMARAMGVDGIVIEDPKELDSLDWTAIFSKDGPTLLDVRIDRDEVPPMQDRIKGLARNESATPGG